MNKTVKFSKMFQSIRNNIGKEITCIYYSHREEKKKVITLTGLKEFEYILFKEEPKYINFVDYNEYIIKLLDHDGNILYENSTFDKSDYNVKDNRSLIIKQKLLYGIDYISSEEKNSKKYLIKAGLKELEPKYQMAWINYVNLYYELGYIDDIKAVIAYLNKINNRMSFYDAEIKVFADEFPNLYHKDIAVKFIDHVYIYNDEYIKYLHSDLCTGGKYKLGSNPKTKKRHIKNN